MGFRSLGFGFEVWECKVWVWGLGVWAWGLEVWGLGFMSSGIRD